MDTGFGCGRCYGDGEDVEKTLAWYRGDNGLVHRGYLVDDSHFIVSLLVCRQCGQAFISVFTEFVDWQGGDDAQYSDILPVTPDEAAELAAQGEDLDLERLGSLGAGRRRLTSEWPSGGPKRVYWSEGRFTVRTGH